jgi:hypothetical protein
VLQALGTIRIRFLQKKSKKKFHACVPLNHLATGVNDACEKLTNDVVDVMENLPTVSMSLGENIPPMSLNIV